MIAWFLGLFVIDTVIGALMLLAFLSAMTLVTARKQVFGGFMLLVAGLALFSIGKGGCSLAVWAWHHQALAAACVGAYLLFGVINLLLRFRGIAKEASEAYMECVRRYPLADGEDFNVLVGKYVDGTLKTTSAFWGHMGDFRERPNVFRDTTFESYPTKYSEFSEALACFFLYWPFDLAWRILHDWVIDLANTVVRELRGVFDAIARREADKVRRKVAQSTAGEKQRSSVGE